jgi:hypothetical protein
MDQQSVECDSIQHNGYRENELFSITEFSDLYTLPMVVWDSRHVRCSCENNNSSARMMNKEYSINFVQDKDNEL